MLWIVRWDSFLLSCKNCKERAWTRKWLFMGYLYNLVSLLTPTAFPLEKYCWARWLFLAYPPQTQQSFSHNRAPNIWCTTQNACVPPFLLPHTAVNHKCSPASSPIHHTTTQGCAFRNQPLTKYKPHQTRLALLLQYEPCSIARTGTMGFSGQEAEEPSQRVARKEEEST